MIEAQNKQEALKTPMAGYNIDRHAFFTDDNFQTLEIIKSNMDDSGTYSISADNDHGSVSCHCNLVVDRGIKDYITPVFVSHVEPSEIKVKEGEELRLSARVEAYPGVGLTWYKDGVRLRPSRRFVITLSYDGIVLLSIGKILKKDSGLYTCVCSNEVGRAQSTARVEVVDKSTDTQNQTVKIKSDIPYSKEPRFLKKPRSTEAFEGDNIIILCEVVGDPKPDVMWLRDFLKIQQIKAGLDFLFEGTFTKR
ncbi:palladin-like [Diabrotica undecimpunctata]|uniref:palladin-like n=1 Tax=Diabrotica undecimpunctata TaxID=50387 RepID=UPI003B63765D